MSSELLSKDRFLEILREEIDRMVHNEGLILKEQIYEAVEARLRNEYLAMPSQDSRRYGPSDIFKS